MRDMFESLSMPYVFPHEGAFALGVGVLIVGLLLFRFALARRHNDSVER